ncbi:hypothetical protein NSK11_contig00226-0005 [Nocardia seriolae]|uniref:Uncharacterized protein n=1 Tax=Nocardia seriolae TaxID=37332 RepID=A0ABC9Z642_9NOCA|nr:hypothetical protein NSERKGN1266_60540 [Nocardia seriolae]BEK94063.1 hypothetical protein NSER024013_19690 [Nocardia seriolae]GAM51276.1 hypothetical protein NS07_v2contig00226-0005 [Nocardia seriolae]GAP33229.1 hypothetical protein NSK11_contig00226-0005 [Nocardia seriolae]
MTCAEYTVSGRAPTAIKGNNKGRSRFAANGSVPITVSANPSEPAISKFEPECGSARRRAP